jgi:cytochrome c oxidase assembly protein subunit 15
MVALTIVAGGFTAGLHAGLIYNTFPLMGGHLIPADYADPKLGLLNVFENLSAVQFDHRLLATLTAITVITAVIAGLRAELPRGARLAVLFMGGAVLTQYALGVATLLSFVAIPLAVAHQGTAVLLLAATLTATHTLRGAK